MSDQLDWVQRQAQPNFRARNHAGTGEYFVYVDNNGRCPHLVAKYCPFEPGVLQTFLYDGLTTADFEPAITLAQEHHNTACRALRWSEYMRDNEPGECQETAGGTA